MARFSTDILIVGHYSHDTLILSPDNPVPQSALGGSASYCSSVFAPAGVSYEVLAKVGGDFRYHDQVLRPPLIVPNQSTSTFLNDYRFEDGRQARLLAACEPILAEEVRAKTEGVRIGMACGVAGEILPETVSALRERSELVLCDAQALIRVVDDQHRVRHVPLERTGHLATLGMVDYLKASREELPYLNLAELRKHTRVIVTDGARGCTLHTETDEIKAPAFEADEVDSTGAGDCFFAGFAWGLLQKLSLKESLRLGNWCGALAVTQIGVPRLSREDLQCRH